MDKGIIIHSIGNTYKGNEVYGCGYWLKIPSLKCLFRLCFALSKCCFKEWGHIYVQDSNIEHKGIYINGGKIK